MLSRAIILLLQIYKRCVSPWLGECCRFHPSCSCYCMDAVRKYGTFRGLWLGLMRICRCHPFHPGGVDYVP